MISLIADQSLVEKFAFDALSVPALAPHFGGRIYSDAAPEGNDGSVCAVFQIVTGEAQIVQDGHVYEMQYELHLRICQRSNSKVDVHEAAAAAHEVLHLRSAVITGVEISAQLMQPINEPYFEGGSRFQQVGGIYLVKVRKA